MHWLVSLWEVCASEFYLTFDEFWFKHTLAQIFLLIDARVERNERADKADKKDEGKIKQIATVEEMSQISKAFGNI